MFTLEQIKEAHAKVNNGSDFSRYISDLVLLGVVRYDTFVLDGHTLFYGKGEYMVTSEVKYPNINITEAPNAEKFGRYLRRHQQGETNYFIFCGHAAESGVEKWIVDTVSMTCTYYDTKGLEMLSEKIAGV